MVTDKDKIFAALKSSQFSFKAAAPAVEQKMQAPEHFLQTAEADLQTAEADLQTAEQDLQPAEQRLQRGKKAFPEKKSASGGGGKGVKEKKVLSSFPEAYDYALNLLSYRDYSEAEMVQRLMRQEASQDNAEAAVAKLVSYGLIKEERYAERVYAAWRQKGCYGRLHLEAELKKRLLKPELQQMILQEFTMVEEIEHAVDAAGMYMERNRKKIAAAQQSQDPKEMRKIMAAGARYMMTRGFSGRYIGILLEKINKNIDI